MQTLIIITLTLMHQLKPKLSQLNNLPNHDKFFQNSTQTLVVMISTITLLITSFD
jgi:hypothetical protein